MKYLKTRDVKNPTRGTGKSAGVDFYIPEFNHDLIHDIVNKNKYEHESNLFYIDYYSQKIILAPNAHILIPSGIKMNLELVTDTTLHDINGNVFIAFNRSSIATKHQLVVGATVIDEDYQGELHISLINNSNRLVILEPRQKIMQFILLKTSYTELTEVTQEQLFTNVSERSENGFGHTNTY